MIFAYISRNDLPFQRNSGFLLFYSGKTRSGEILWENICSPPPSQVYKPRHLLAWGGWAKETNVVIQSLEEFPFASLTFDWTPVVDHTLDS